MRNRLSIVTAILACVVCSFFLFSTQQEAQLILPIIVGTTSDTVVANACNTQGGNPANCSLRGAILQANVGSSNSIIRFELPESDPFCSSSSCTINLTSALPTITEPLSIVGPGADKLTVRPVIGGQFGIFHINALGPTSVTISGLTIKNGVAGAGSAGIHNSQGILNVTSCTITGNQSGSGGGIANHGGLNVTNSTISDNTGNSGGGIFSGNGASMNITNSTISRNNGGVGGAGGITIGTGIATVTNSTLSGNTAGSSGGAIYNIGALSVSNSTVSGNSAGSGDQGGGIYNSGTARVKNSIIALNTGSSGPDVFGNFVSDGFNLIGKRNGSMGFENVTDQTGTIAAPLDPMLHPLGLQDNGGPTHTIALRTGSPAIDKASTTPIGPADNLTTDQRGIFRRAFNNTSVPNASDGADIGAFELQGRSPADFDGDHKTDIGIFRPTPAEWWVYRSTTGATFATQFGATTDKLAPGDYTGDGKADIAFWRPSTGFWFVLRSEDFSFFAFPWGTTGDIPAPADYTGDGTTDAAVFRPSTGTWFIVTPSLQITTTFGLSGDVPVAADYDGDQLADFAIYRPSLGQWWIMRWTGVVTGTTFGDSNDKPVQGDYTGDGKADIAFWRPSTGQWFVVRSEDSSFFSFAFGANGDIPAPGDYDGDGRHDATVFRPSSATWFSQRTTSGTLIQQFGVNGDRPVPSAFVP